MSRRHLRSTPVDFTAGVQAWRAAEEALLRQAKSERRAFVLVLLVVATLTGAMLWRLGVFA